MLKIFLYFNLIMLFVNFMITIRRQDQRDRDEKMKRPDFFGWIDKDRIGITGCFITGIDTSKFKNGDVLFLDPTRPGCLTSEASNDP